MYQGSWFMLSQALFQSVFLLSGPSTADLAHIECPAAAVSV